MATRAGDNSFLVCENCQEITELKDVGIAIYRYKINLGNVEEDNTGNIDVNTGSTKDIFLVINTKEMAEQPARAAGGEDKNKITCKRCLHIAEHRQKLLQDTKNIDKNIVSDVCEHCRAKIDSRDVRVLCDEIISKYFLSARRDRDKHMQTWFRPSTGKTETESRKHLRWQLANQDMEDETRQLRAKYHSEDSFIKPFPGITEEEAPENQIIFPKEVITKEERVMSVSSLDELSGIQEKQDLKEAASRGRRKANLLGWEDQEMQRTKLDKNQKVVVQSYGKMGDSDRAKSAIMDEKEMLRIKKGQSPTEVRREQKVSRDTQSPQAKEGQIFDKEKAVKAQTASKGSTELKSKPKAEKDQLTKPPQDATQRPPTPQKGKPPKMPDSRIKAKNELVTPKDIKTDKQKTAKDVKRPEQAKDIGPQEKVKEREETKLTEGPKVIQPEKKVKKPIPPQVVKDTKPGEKPKETKPSQVVKEKDIPKPGKDKEKALKSTEKGKGDQLSEKEKDLKPSQKDKMPDTSKKDKDGKPELEKDAKLSQKEQNEMQAKIKAGKLEKERARDEKLSEKGGKDAKTKGKEEKAPKKPLKERDYLPKHEKTPADKGPKLAVPKAEEVSYQKEVTTVMATNAGPHGAQDLPPAKLLDDQLKEIEERAKKMQAADSKKPQNNMARELKMNEVIMATDIDTLQYALPTPSKTPVIPPELPPIPGRYTLLDILAEKPDQPLAFQSKIDRYRAKSTTGLNLNSREEAILRTVMTTTRDKQSLKKLSPLIVDSDMELDIESLLATHDKTGDRRARYMIKGTQIVRNKESGNEVKKAADEPLFFHTKRLATVESFSRDSEESTSLIERDIEEKQPLSYALSDRTFIEKGWTMLPTEKVLRKMNIYRMRPSRPDFDWFKRNKSKGLMHYETGEKLAEFEEDGRARCYYKNGRLAFNYYASEEANSQQRYVVYSSGELDSRGHSRPVTILAMFDYAGNGIVFDHNGKIRLKYNQSEGVILDRSLGPVTHWKWHSLNDPPVLQQVMIDTHMTFKDPEIIKLGKNVEDHKGRPEDDEKMLAIEFDNFVKEKSKKLSAKFHPYQVKMKALEINEQFSLKILDQATIYLLYKEGTTHIKFNLGMTLDHHEIVDTETVEVGDVSNSLEKFPAKTGSLEELQLCLNNTQRMSRVRTEREHRIRPPAPRTVESADQLAAAVSHPLHPSNAGQAGQRRKPPTTFLYYDTRLI